MVGDVINVLIIFSVIFGIVYIAISSRTRIRLALIEKGADASIFYTPSQGRKSNLLPIILVNLALLLIGIGLGIFGGAVLSQNFGVDTDAAYPGMIFTLAGTGLFTGYKISSRLVKE